MKKPPSLANVARPTAAPAPHVLEAHQAINGPNAGFVRLSVNLPTEIHRKLKMKATAEGRSIKELVLQLVGDYVNR
jgi:hypothetical protein